VTPYARNRRKINKSCRAAKAKGVRATMVVLAYFRAAAALERCVITACEHAVKFATRPEPPEPIRAVRQETVAGIATRDVVGI
jgi:hypothetical protein